MTLVATMMLSLKFLILIITFDLNFSGLYNADYLIHTNFIDNIRITTYTHSYTQLQEFYSVLDFNTVIKYYQLLTSFWK